VAIAYLDFIWSALALLYDAEKLTTINWYLWPIVLTCPLFPFLLAIVFYKIIKGKAVNQYLLVFASIPSAVFGILALVFYPMLMLNEGFNIWGLGQILWVLFYSVQGWYLIIRYKIGRTVLLIVDIYLLVKLTLDYYYLSFGYLDLDKLSNNQLAQLFATALVTVLLLNIMILRRKRAIDR